MSRLSPILRLMNNPSLLATPAVSRLALRRARSLSYIEALLNLQSAILPQRAFARTHGISRWNE